MKLTASQEDFCAGVSLLYMGADGVVDEYIQRMMIALRYGDAEEAEHISALMLSLLHMRGDPNFRKLSDRWNFEFIYQRAPAPAASKPEAAKEADDA